MEKLLKAKDGAKLLEVCAVKPLDGYKIWVRFNNGEARTVDMSPLLEQPAFVPLKDKNVFDSVYIDYGCTVWLDGDVDIAPEYLFVNGREGTKCL